MTLTVLSSDEYSFYHFEQCECSTDQSTNHISYWKLIEYEVRDSELCICNVMQGFTPSKMRDHFIFTNKLKFTLPEKVAFVYVLELHCSRTWTRHKYFVT